MPITVPDRFHNVSLAGNTAGALAEISSGTLTLAGGNNITLSQAGNAVTISGAAAGGAAFSGGDSNIGNTSGDTGVVTGQMVLVGGNNITLSGSTNGGSISLTISGANVGGAQTGISGLANSETTYTSGSVTLSALGAITIRSTTGQHFQFSVNSQTQENNTLGMSNIGNTAGDTSIRTGPQLQIVLAGGNNITLSQSTNGSSATVTISAFNQTQESNTIGMSNIGNTAGDTAIRSAAQLRIVFAGGNNITLSQSTNGSSATVTISAFNQTQESNTIGMSNIGNTAGDTAIRSAAQLRIVFAGGNNITLSQSTNGSSATVTISAFNQSQESNTIGMSNIGNTSGDTAIRSAAQLRIVLAGGNNITLSQSTNGSSATITISAFNQTSPVVGADIASVSSATNSGTATSQFAAEDHVHAGVGPFGVSNIGNTSGDTGTLYGRVVLAGGNNVTLSVSSSNNGAQTITISAAAGGGAAYSAGLSNIGNTSGDTGLATQRLVLAGGNNITLSGSTDGGSMTITVSAGAGAGLSAGLSNIGNTEGDTGIVTGRLVLAGGQGITLSGSTNAGSETITIRAVPDLPYMEYPPGHGRHQMQTLGHISFAVQPFYVPARIEAHSIFWVMSASGASGSTASITFPIGIYSQQTGASSSRLSLIASVQFTTSWTSNSVAAGDWLGVFGIRRWAAPLNLTLTPGWYWWGIGHRTSNAGSFTFGCHGSNAMSGVFGQTFGTRHVLPMAGIYATTTLTAPDSILSNQILMNNNVRALPWMALGNTDSIDFGD